MHAIESSVMPMQHHLASSSQKTLGGPSVQAIILEHSTLAPLTDCTTGFLPLSHKSPEMRTGPPAFPWPSFNPQGESSANDKIPGT